MKKGFTLIELLATIVILAVIALITIPTIVGVVEKTRRNAAKQSANMYKKMIGDSIAIDSINSKMHTSGIYQVDEENSTIYNSSEDKIKVYGKGELPSEGYVCLDEKMSVGNYSLKIGNYIVIKTNDIVDVEKQEQLDMIRCYVPEVTINVEDSDKWTQSKTISLEQSSTNKVKLIYKIVYQDGTTEDWKEYNETFTMTKPGTIYTKLINSTNVISYSTRTITKIDADNPVCELVVSKYTIDPYITIQANCEDKTDLIYNFSKDNGTTYTDKNNTNYITYSTFEISKMKAKVVDEAGNNITLKVNEDSKNNTYYELASLIESDAFLVSHPVGSIYMTTSSDESTVEKMNSKYGGTWEVYGDGRVLQSSTGESGLTGGNNEITLSKANIPSLSVSGTTDSTGSGYSIGYGSATRVSTTAGNHMHYIYAPEGHTWASGWSSPNYPLTTHSFAATFSIQPNTLNTDTWYGNALMYASDSGTHSHTVDDYYATSVSGVEAHTHAFTGTYTNNSQTKINVQNRYITTYMYKRIS